MFVNQGSINSETIDVSNLTNKLCLMTGCDQESAIMQLINCNYDLQMAAEKILELTTDNQEVDDGWQTINRQKKFKKKENKVDINISEENIKRNSVNRNSKLSYSNVNPKTGNFKNDEKLNYIRSRNKRYRNIQKSKENLEYSHNPTDVPGIVFNLKDEELRWDNVADIEGGLKESSSNSVVDGFYSDDDFGIPEKFNDDSFQEIEIPLTSTINSLYNCNNENYSKSADKIMKTVQDSVRSEPVVPDSKILSQLLPIFGKYSKTELPKSLPIVPNKPVVFAISMRFRQSCSKARYNFGSNVSDVLAISNSSEFKLRIPICQSNSITKPAGDGGKPYHLKQLENQILSSNNANFKNISIHGGLSNKETFGILEEIYKQQKEVAMVLKQHPSQSYYPFNKPINMIPISNSNSPGHIYSLSQENIYPQMENGMAHQNQDCLMSNPFPTSINMSVPFM